MTTPRLPRVSKSALAAFRNMVAHQMQVWNAADELEEELGHDVSTTEALDWVAAAFSTVDEAMNLNDKDTRAWLNDYLNRQRRNT